VTFAYPVISSLKNLFNFPMICRKEIATEKNIKGAGVLPVRQQHPNPYEIQGAGL
jgi:hypothetical protein